MSVRNSVLVSTVLKAPLAKSWSLLREFDYIPGLPREAIQITNATPNTTVGAVRKITFPDGNHVIETLRSFSDEENFFSYTIDTHSEGAFASPALKEYTGKVNLFSVTETGETFARWEATWLGEDSEATKKQIHTIFSTALCSLGKLVQAEVSWDTSSIKPVSATLETSGFTTWYQVWGHGPLKAVFLHGGPGNCVADYGDVNTLILDPSKYTVLEIDQLGCGFSVPSVRKGLSAAKHYKDVRAQDLVKAIVQVLDTLKWDKVYLHGGSWGSALALIFAEMNPERVTGMVIRGIFTGTLAEMDVIYTKAGAGTNKHMNEAFDSIYAYAQSVGYEGGPQNSEAFVKFFRDLLLEAKDESVADVAAWNWRAQENWAMGETDSKFNEVVPGPELEESRSVAFWEAHIFYEMLWGSQPVDILGDLKNIPKHIPVSIVQGLGDEVTPPTFAKALEKKFRDEGFEAVDAAYVDDGHKVTGNSIREAVRDAVERFAARSLAK